MRFSVLRNHRGVPSHDARGAFDSVAVEIVTNGARITPTVGDYLRGEGRSNARITILYFHDSRPDYIAEDDCETPADRPLRAFRSGRNYLGSAYNFDTLGLLNCLGGAISGTVR